MSTIDYADYGQEKSIIITTKKPVQLYKMLGLIQAVVCKDSLILNILLYKSNYSLNEISEHISTSNKQYPSIFTILSLTITNNLIYIME